MFRIAFLFMALCVPAFAQPPRPVDVPDEAREEILRRGNSVTIIDGFRSVGGEGNEALQPPADDSHKWFITVWKSDGCVPCEALISDWKESKYLLAWAKPNDPQKGWAFFNCYSKDDKLQNFRLKNIKLKGTPTIIIQPPRNGEYGDPSTVVCQITGYDRDDRALALKMSEAVQLYVLACRSNRGRFELDRPRKTVRFRPMHPNTLQRFERSLGSSRCSNLRSMCRALISHRSTFRLNRLLRRLQRRHRLLSRISQLQTTQQCQAIH